MRTLALFVTYYGGAAYGLLNPLFGALLFVHILILRPEYLVWGSPVFGRIHLVVFTCAMLGCLFRMNSAESRIVNPWSKRLLMILGALVLWALLVSLNAEHSVEASLDQTIALARIWLLCWLLSRTLMGVKAVTAYVDVVGFSYGFVALWGILQGMAGNPRLDELGMGGSNYLAAQLALVAPMCLAMALRSDRGRLYRIGHAITTLLVATCALWTGSRGGMVGLAVGFATFALFSGPRTFAKIIGIAAIGGLVVWPYMPETIGERINSIFSEELDPSAASRTVLWEWAVIIWKQHPILGVGLHNYSAARLDFGRSFQDGSETLQRILSAQQRMPHSMFLGFLAEAGAVGAGLLCWMVGRAMLARTKAQAGDQQAPSRTLLARGAQAGIAGFAVAALFGDFQYVEMLYAQMVLIGAIRSLNSDGTDEAEGVKRSPEIVPAARGQ
jgi:O-antigen ligase